MFPCSTPYTCLCGITAVIPAPPFFLCHIPAMATLPTQTYYLPIDLVRPAVAAVHCKLPHILPFLLWDRTGRDPTTTIT